jgi:REP element-mobilizing transposase RayT
MRIEFPGAIYHVTARGNVRQDIFLGEKDCRRFESALTRTVEKCQWVIHAHCLMPNHYHLLLETPEANLSAGMRYLNGTYAQVLNRRHNRSGHAFEGRFKAILVERESYLLELCRYVVLNPVRAGMVTMPGEWQWSSYAATIGKAPVPRFLHIEWILQQFGNNTATSRRSYEKFVLEGIKCKPP